MKDSIVFYKSFADAIADLDEKDQLAAFWNIIRYAFDGVEPEDSGPARAIFRMAKPQIDANEKRYQNGTKGGRPITENKPSDNQDVTKTEPRHNQDITKTEPNVNVNVNDNVNDNANVNVNENDNVCDNIYVTEDLKTDKDVKESHLSVTREKFTPPTLEEVEAYSAERGYAVDAERFIDFYESKGWMIGKNRMKDWKAAVRNWSRSDAERQERTAKPKQSAYMDAVLNRVDMVEDWVHGGQRK